ncbi:hypothetical protein [Gryllotalpicola sp.]|uniref:hypothetical protein n=1 Tax=Gryllotalpicola sp. TaxID=1932787 RepID=UPI0026230235|nr:hypothetical protein [Gryllotalpicola sp.]
MLVSSHVLSELEEFSDAAVFIEAGTTVSAERVAAARVGRREWRIFSPSPDRLRQVLASLALPPGSSREANGSFYIVIEGGESAAAALLERLVAGGAPVAVFAPAVGELEHTFLDLQQGGR